MTGSERGRHPFRAPIVLGSSTLLLITWEYFGSPAFHRDHLASVFAFGSDPLATAELYHSGTAVLLLLLVPAFIIKAIFRESLFDYGVGIGETRRTLLSILVLVPLFVLIGYFASNDSQVAAVYPANRGACASPAAFALHAFSCGWLYLSWEFLFRGYLQQGLRELGAPTAVMVQVLASTLIHVGGPASETYGAILGGILWGILVLRTRSLLPGILQHGALGLAADYSICFLRA